MLNIDTSILTRRAMWWFVGLIAVLPRAPARLDNLSLSITLCLLFLSSFFYIRRESFFSNNTGIS